MKRLLSFVLIIAAGYGLHYWEHTDTSAGPAGWTPQTQAETSWRSGQQVGGSGKVIRILPDDNDGSRHQRFILQLGSGRTLLIAHNIDIASRLPGLAVGDAVAFYGQFEMNSQGGVIHWTHRDPQGRHVAGWLEHRGRRYQ